MVANILERSRNLSPRALSKQRVFDTPHSDGTADSDMKHSKPMGVTPAVKAPKKIKGIASLLGLHGGEEDESRLESQASRRRRVTIGAGGPFQCATDPSAATFNTPTKLCVDTKDAKCAETVLERMTQTRVKPDVVAFNTLLQPYVDTKDAKGA